MQVRPSAHTNVYLLFPHEALTTYLLHYLLHYLFHFPAASLHSSQFTFSSFFLESQLGLAVLHARYRSSEGSPRMFVTYLINTTRKHISK